MKQMTVIYDIGRIKDDFMHRASLSYHTGEWRYGTPDEIFLTWLVSSLETMFCVVPSFDTLCRIDYSYLSVIDNRFDMLSVLLYQQIQIPKFTGDYRFHVRLLNDDLFLIF